MKDIKGKQELPPVLEERFPEAILKWLRLYFDYLRCQGTEHPFYAMSESVQAEFELNYHEAYLKHIVDIPWKDTLKLDHLKYLKLFVRVEEALSITVRTVTQTPIKNIVMHGMKNLPTVPDLVRYFTSFKLALENSNMNDQEKIVDLFIEGMKAFPMLKHWAQMHREATKRYQREPELNELYLLLVEQWRSFY